MSERRLNRFIFRPLLLVGSLSVAFVAGNDCQHTITSQDNGLAAKGRFDSIIDKVGPAVANGTIGTQPLLTPEEGQQAQIDYQTMHNDSWEWAIKKSAFEGFIVLGAAALSFTSLKSLTRRKP